MSQHAETQPLPDEPRHSSGKQAKTSGSAQQDIVRLSRRVGLILGSLTGLAAGLSSSAVANILVSAAGAVALATTTWQSNSRTRRRGLETDAVLTMHRHMAFGMSCLVTLLLGLWLRSHGVFGMSAADRVEYWKSAGFTAEVSRCLVATELLGNNAEGESSDSAPLWLGSLFDTQLPISADVALAHLDPNQYADEESARSAIALLGAPYASLAQIVGRVSSEADRVALWTAIYDVCRHRHDDLPQAEAKRRP